VTHHSHVREADVHYVDTETCVHRLLPVAPSSQCPRPPAFLVAGLPSCDGHVVPVVVDQHSRGNPDVVVRRIL